LDKKEEPVAKRENDIPVLVHDRTTLVRSQFFSTSIDLLNMHLNINSVQSCAFSGEPTHIVALDCEYVGGGTDGSDDLLARVSIVNEEGHIVYDKYVKPRERVTDFRTSVSGIRPADIAKGLPFDVVQREVAKILKDRIVVGHALNNDFRVLCFQHNSKLTRDTAKCQLLRKMANCNGLPSLKRLANAVLGIDIQQGEHDSVIDARVALRLYYAVKKKWESDLKRYRH
uniref:RNA exonuclease 4 n=1 Tax=Heligmosomoides polygyrus TaxID=6339 RepID=A0A8L8KSU5_HELPZ